MRRCAFAMAIVLGCAGVPAAAETIEVFDNHGGSVAQYDSRWAGLAARGVDVKIVGPCQSACTVLLGHIPRSKICVTPSASFGFHLATLDVRQDARLLRSLTAGSEDAARTLEVFAAIGECRRRFGPRGRSTARARERWAASDVRPRRSARPAFVRTS